ncbi:ABC transporter permease [Spirochaeta isovalerica]|uniref:ABC-2 type transport system permease protein n=1 Tax=Spirochaeta isovalerica TaxID=150 RepID=A0A841R9F5_9SPIO|nr:ABC-2 family transporter protein [Spirochaeta isovalerica]MBB6480535.1 ABC-2 type transport system permease protein [Spirochaeta isovalerica]
MNSLYVWRQYAAQSLKSQMEYRKSFLLQMLGQLLIIGSEFAGVWSLFHRFGNIKGWSLGEASVFYGMISIGFAMSQMISGGFERAGQLIRTGELDRILLRPRSTELQLFGFEFSLRRTGRLIVGTAVLIYGLSELQWNPSLLKIMILLWAVSGSMALFCGLMIIQAGISIWTIESLELMNTLTYGGQETGRYPVSIYSAPFRYFFTYIVPLAAVNYYPVLIIINKADPGGSAASTGWFSPAAGFLFLAGALLFWRYALKFYRSAGG